MPQSTDRILTTHAGSLPMPADLHAMLRAKEAGQPYDAPALQMRLTRAVAEVVQQQAEHGLDIISDGEQSKTSFTTYVSERLAGIETRPGAVARGQRSPAPGLPRVLRGAAGRGTRRRAAPVLLRRAIAVHWPGSGADGHRQPAERHGWRAGRGGLPSGRRRHR